jgi:hypothetical protein
MKITTSPDGVPCYGLTTRERIACAIQKKLSALRWRIAEWITPNEGFGKGSPSPFRIIRCEYPDGLIGIGAQFFRRGKLVRFAVKMSASPTREEVLKAITMLAAASAKPDAPESRAVYGEDPLIGHEMKAL